MAGPESIQALQGLMAQGDSFPGMGGEPAMAPVDSLGEEVMPMASNKATGELFVDKDLFNGAKVKRGQRVMLYGTVTAVGNRIGVQPDKGAMDSEGAEDEMDDDLDDDIDEEKSKF